MKIKEAKKKLKIKTFDHKKWYSKKKRKKRKNPYLQLLLVILMQPSYFLYILLFILLMMGIFLKIFYNWDILIIFWFVFLRGQGHWGEERLFQFFFSFSFILFQALITGNENSVFIIYLIFKSGKNELCSCCIFILSFVCWLCDDWVLVYVKEYC